MNMNCSSNCQSDLLNEENTNGGNSNLVGVSGQNALDKIIAYAMKRRKLATAVEPYQWNREEIYANDFYQTSGDST